MTAIPIQPRPAPGLPRNARAALTRQQTVAVAIFVGVIFAAFTRLAPLAERRGFDSVLDTGSGDLTRQLYYIALLAVTLAISRMWNWRQVPLAFAALYGWFALTLAWSPAPEIAGRRFALSAIVAIITLLPLSQVPFDRIFRSLHWAIFAMLLAGLLAAPVLHDRTFHLAGDTESGIVGDFRGVFYHKNQLGFAAAADVMLSLWYIAKTPRRRKLGWFALACAALSLAMSRSKTPLGFTLLCIPIYFLWSRFRAMRVVIPMAFVFLLMLSGVFYDKFIEILSDPNAFTGRVYIWQETFNIFWSHPLIGVGYQSIFEAGEHTLFGAGTSNVFLATLVQAHNSYLEIAASTGLIGLVLLFNMLRADIFQALGRARLDLRDEAMVASLSLLILLVSLEESGLGDRDYAAWVVTMAIVAALQGRVALVNMTLRQRRGLPVPVAPRQAMDRS